MKLKSRKLGLLTQAVLASSVCLMPMTVMGAQFNVTNADNVDLDVNGNSVYFDNTGGAAPPAPQLKLDATPLSLGAEAANTANVPLGGSATTALAGVGTIAFNGNASIAGTVGVNIGGGQTPINGIKFLGGHVGELKGHVYLQNNIDFNNQAATLKLSPQLAGTPLIISAADITSNGGNTGTIKFDDTVADTQVDIIGTIGAAAAPTAIEVGTASANKVTAYVQGNVILGGATKTIQIFNNDILKVATGINITAPSGINGGGAGDKGTLLFEGASTVSGAVGGVNKLNLVNVSGAGVVKFVDNVTATNTTIANGGTLQLDDGNTIASIIDGAAPGGQGTLDFVGDGVSSVGAVGATNPLNLITIDSGLAGGKTVEFSGGNVSATTINFLGNAGGNSTVQFTSANNIVNANFTTKIHQKNVIDFANTDILNGNIGAENKEFAQVLVVENGPMTLNGNVWAQNLHLKANQILTVSDGFSINGTVTTENAGQGTLKFAGTSIVGGQIGTDPTAAGKALALVSTNGTGTVQLAHDIFATDTQLFDTSTLKITVDGKTINGNFEAKGAGSTLNVQTNTFNVTGNATFGANDRLQIAITDAGNGFLNVTGDVTVDAASILALDTTGGTNTGYIKSGTYTVITKGGGGGALVAIPVQAGTSAILSGKTLVNGNNLDLVITRTGLDNAAFNPGPQGSGVGSALETAGANGQLTQGLQDLMSGLQNLDTPAKVTTALQTFTPNVSGGAIQGSIAAIDAGVGVLNERMEVARSGVGSYNRGMSAGDVFDHNMGLWAQVVGSDFTQDMRGGVAGYDGNNLGAMFGADWKLTDELLFGVAAGYGTTDIDFDLAGSTLNIDTWQASAYGSWTFNEPWFVDGMLGFAHHSYDQRRNIILPPSLTTALANYNGWEWVAHVRAGYEHQEGDWTITPAVSLKYSNLSIDDYNETNAGAASLSVANKDVDAFVAGLGLKVEYRAGMFAPEAHASAFYDFNASRQETNNLFLGSTVGFTTTGVKPAHDSYEVGAGLNVYAMDQLQLNLHYDYSFKSDFHSHTGFFKIRYEW